MNSQKFIFFLLIFVLCTLSIGTLLLSCSDRAIKVGNTDTFNFNNPNKIWQLPDVLQEVSGVCLIDSVTLAMVQDEKGSVFFYSIKQKELIGELPFANDGDYEGICRLDSHLVVLRSDGELFFIHHFSKFNGKVEQFSTDVPAENNEGLCYAIDKHQLWIGSKSKLDKERRGVFAWDIEAQKLMQEPCIEIEMTDIKSFIVENEIPFPIKSKKKGSASEPWVKFAISALASHPKTKDVYILSALDHALFIFSPTHQLKDIILLNEKLFPKPEGISFFENGDMLITNEGKDHHPTLLWFKYNGE